MKYLMHHQRALRGAAEAAEARKARTAAGGATARGGTGAPRLLLPSSGRSGARRSPMRSESALRPGRDGKTLVGGIARILWNMRIPSRGDFSPNWIRLTGVVPTYRQISVGVGNKLPMLGMQPQNPVCPPDL